MYFPDLHPWLREAKAAIGLQEALAGRVRLQPPLSAKWEIIAGTDVSCNRFSRTVWATVVVLRWSDQRVLEIVGAKQEAEFPYIPGLLAFREIPVVLQAFRKLKTAPDLVLCDGQGIAHPRFMGLASHLGLWLEIPTIGCAKTKLVGDYDEPDLKVGDWTRLEYRHRQVGIVLRTRKRARPLFISPGHLMDFKLARELVLSCCLRGKIPEPLRQAHLAANDYRTGKIEIM